MILASHSAVSYNVDLVDSVSLGSLVGLASLGSLVDLASLVCGEFS